MRKTTGLRSFSLFKRPCLPSGAGSPVMCVELNYRYERNLPPAKFLLADDAIAAACAEMKNYWDSTHSIGPSKYKKGPKTGYKGEKKSIEKSAKIVVTDRKDRPTEESRTVTIPFRHSNSSSWFFLSSNTSTSRSKFVFSCRVKISFRTSRWSIPKE